MSETSKGSRRQSRLAALMPEIRQRLVELGTPLLLTETEGRLALAERKIAAFERKYKSPWPRLIGMACPMMPAWQCTRIS